MAKIVICSNFSRSWVRVFEVGSKRIAEAAFIKADIEKAVKECEYWKRVQKAVWSDPEVLESCKVAWQKEAGCVDSYVIEAKKQLADAHLVWMKPTKTE